MLDVLQLFSPLVWKMLLTFFSPKMRGGAFETVIHSVFTSQQKSMRNDFSIMTIVRDMPNVLVTTTYPTAFLSLKSLQVPPALTLSTEHRAAVMLRGLLVSCSCLFCLQAAPESCNATSKSKDERVEQWVQFPKTSREVCCGWRLLKVVVVVVVVVVVYFVLETQKITKANT